VWMSEQPTRFYSSAQVRELDRRAIAGGIAGYALMQRAAYACWLALRERWPLLHTIHVVAGPGNNGGDGYEIARLAKAGGRDVRVWSVGEPDAGDAVTARKAWLADGGTSSPFDDRCLSGAQVIVDALLGIGGSRPLEGRYAGAVSAMNAAARDGAKVLSVDVPSGLDADTGRVWGVAVQADVTVTFIGRKLGLYTGAGPACTGAVVFAALDVPEPVYAKVDSLAEEINRRELAQHLPRRSRTAHKGGHGHVLIVGGDEGFAGAALMAARAVLRAGSGLVSVATHPVHAAALVAAQPEIMCRGVRSPSDLVAQLEAADVVAIGPGLGQTAWGRGLWSHLATAKKNLVVDADGLNWLAQNPQRRGDWILTPHPGEAARLLEISTAEIQSDRAGAAAKLQQRYGGVVVLKGAGTLVQGSWLSLCTAGNPGMAVGGMGDVLTGIIAGFFAQGLDAEAAARVGVLVHALAGDRAAQRGGERGLLPSDLIDELRPLANP
jgi:hydroxyethylthiazole kinase-like uncharacterized protein yjeF